MYIYMGASYQPRSGKRYTGLRLISASFGSQGTLDTHDPSGYLTFATCIALPDRAPCQVKSMTLNDF